MTVVATMSLDTTFVGTVTSKQQMSLTITLLVKGRDVSFKLDTDAEVTAIYEETYQHLGEANQSPIWSCATDPRCTRAIHNYTKVQAAHLSIAIICHP